MGGFGAQLDDPVAGDVGDAVGGGADLDGRCAGGDVDQGGERSHEGYESDREPCSGLR